MCPAEQCLPCPPAVVTQQCQQTQTGSPCDLCPGPGIEECRGHSARRGTAPPELVRAPPFVLSAVRSRQRHNSGNERFCGSAASRGLCWALSTAPLSLSRACVSVWDCQGFLMCWWGRKGCLRNCISHHRPVHRYALTEMSPWCLTVLSLTGFLGFVSLYPSMHQFHLSVSTQGMHSLCFGRKRTLLYNDSKHQLRVAFLLC